MCLAPGSPPRMLQRRWELVISDVSWRKEREQLWRAETEEQEVKENVLLLPFFSFCLSDQGICLKTGYFCPLEHTTSSSSSSSKRPRLDQIPAANLDADDPLTDVRTKNIFFNVFLIIWLLKSVCYGVGGWRLRLRFWQWWWHRCPAGWTREDQERESWGTGEEGESCWLLLAN